MEEGLRELPLAGFGSAPVVECVAQDLMELLFPVLQLLGFSRGEAGLAERGGCGFLLLGGEDG